MTVEELSRLLGDSLSLFFIVILVDIDDSKNRGPMPKQCKMGQKQEKWNRIRINFFLFFLAVSKKSRNLVS